MFLISLAVMPSRGFLIYFSLGLYMNFGYIVCLLSVDIFGMEHTEDKVQQDLVPKSGECHAEPFIRFEMSCIEPVITCHLEMFFGDLLDEKGNESEYRNSFSI